MSIPYQFQIETILKEERTTESNLEEIQKWLPTASLPNLQNEMISLFLISCVNDIELTKKTIISYFKIKSETPEMFSERDMDSEVLQKAMNVIICISIPQRLADNTVIHFFKLTDTNYRHFDLINNMKLGLMLVDVSQNYNPPNELVVVIDMKGANVMHLTCVKLGAIKKFIEYVQEAMPLRIQRIHVLNTNYVFEKALAIAKLFMKSELLSLVVPHSPKMNMEEFYQDWIPKACLPNEYGGELPTTEELNQMTIQQFTELKEFYQAEERLISSYSDNSK